MLEVFAALVEQGLVYRALKPVHWSIANQTALAEAELEYQRSRGPLGLRRLRGRRTATRRRPGLRRRGSTRRRQLHDLDDDAVDAAGEPGDRRARAVPSTRSCGWTAASPCVADASCVERGRRGCRRRSVEVLGETDGRSARRPALPPPVLIDRDRAASWPPTTSRSRTAPARPHRARPRRRGLPDRPRRGPRDLLPGARRRHLRRHRARVAARHVGLGRQRRGDRAPARRPGTCSTTTRFTHSYPHDWRIKTPMIFRAHRAVVRRRGPADGARRQVAARRWRSTATRGEIALRPRVGPQPAARHARVASRLVHLAPALVGPADPRLPTARRRGAPDRGVGARGRRGVRRARAATPGSRASPAELLAGYDPRRPTPTRRDEPRRRRRSTKMYDIFDVWFESGSSWNAVDASSAALGYPGRPLPRGLRPAPRLVPALAAAAASASPAQPPFKARPDPRLHGRQGRPEDAQVGRQRARRRGSAQGLRRRRLPLVGQLARASRTTSRSTWSSSSSPARRTARCATRCASCSAISPTSTRADDGRVRSSRIDPTSLDAYVLTRRDRARGRVARGATSSYDFRRAHQLLYDFCNDTLSRVLLRGGQGPALLRPAGLRAPPARPDRDVGADRAARRLLAPILPHTADEAWRALHGDDACVHLETADSGLRQRRPGLGAGPRGARDGAQGARGLDGREQARRRAEVERPGRHPGSLRGRPRGRVRRLARRPRRHRRAPKSSTCATSRAASAPGAVTRPSPCAATAAGLQRPRRPGRRTLTPTRHGLAVLAWQADSCA